MAIELTGANALRGILLVSAALFAANGATATSYDPETALATSQAAVGGSLREIVLRDVDGQAFDLRSLQGKPLVISMIYTSCHHICPMITQSLSTAADIGFEALGDDAFSIVTVGFDWQEDTPERMRMFSKERRVNTANWYFLAGDEHSIRTLSEDLGFQYYRSAKGFDHLNQTSIVRADGTVFRQIYGIDVDPRHLVEPLKELVFDTPSTAGVLDHWVDTFRLFCTVYDPNSGRYRFDYSIATAIFVGVLCLGAVAAFIAREWRHAR